ncbi:MULTISPECIES: hypothetical protein [unclassified Lysinibacillus]|uniref:hypothetical protein n=1 Tax=unclassified Lysinibacillus TaxID=2636778 RepID=UPI00104A54BE
MEETKCQVCTTYEAFENLIEIGTEPKQAFHIVVSQLIASTLETAIEEAYDEGYEVGFKEASNDIAEIVGSYAKAVKEA